MTEFNPSLPTQDERIMAALAHIAALLPMWGIIAAAIIWITQKEKSKYVGFQALQALAYQLIMIAAWILGMGCYMVSFFGVFFAVPFAAPSENPQAVWPFLGATLFPFLIFGAIFLLGFLFIAYGIAAAIMVFQGKPFRYVILGRAIERFLEPKQKTGGQ